MGEHSHPEEVPRGRRADAPSQIPRRGWLDVAWRVKDDISRDNASLIAAGLALYGLLAAFPALTAALSLYGMFVPPEQAASQVQSFAGSLPGQAASIIRTQIHNMTAHQSGALGFGAVIGLVIALWSARKGMAALMAATNVAYDEEEERGFFKLVLVSLAFTAASVAGFVLVLVVAVAVPVAVQSLGLPGVLQVLVNVVRWVLLWLCVGVGLTVVYRYGPDRRKPAWRWVTWGSAIAATLWIVGSVLFAQYVRNFGSYGQTYGTLGGVVILLLWFYLSGFVIVLGAEINAELERQTERDTTAGAGDPMGQREAYAADTLGEARD